MAKDDITVNCVVKGDIRHVLDMTDEDVEKAAECLPVKKLGTPEDIAYPSVFLRLTLHNTSTGQTLFVCGGKSMYFSMSV